MNKRLRLQLIMPVRKDPESFIKARKAVKYYEQMGYRVIDPHEVAADVMAEEGFNARTEAKIQATCMQMLTHADLAIVFPGWKNSEGCRGEIHFCTSHDIPLYLHQDYKDEKKRVYFTSYSPDAVYEHFVEHDTVEEKALNGKEVKS